tara:strand:- start:13 stop:294 length:282 start_codon:yes stop_codon:yes gene_type:complete
MIQFTEASIVNKPQGSMVIWSMAKRMRDIKPWQIKNGKDYIVRKTETGPWLIYRAVDGRLKSLGYEFVRWGIFSDSPDDLLRVPTRKPKPVVQ